MDHDSSAAGAPYHERPREITTAHLEKLAIVYVRQSSPGQVRDHPGSAAAQYDLADVARRWGWPESRIRVMDGDQGQSGVSASKRTDYLKIMTLIDQGQVGIVIVQDLTRLCRNDADMASLLDLAEETDTLICTGGVIRDPASVGTRFEGYFGAHDNRARARRIMDARIAKARRGQAVSRPPIGYVRTSTGQWVKDPDRHTQEAIERLFRLYLKLGSLGKVIKHLKANDFKFPRRRGGLVIWAPADAALLHNVLRNPAYAGDYVFGRCHAKTGSSSSRRRAKGSTLAEPITIPDHHADEAYIPREEWQLIQEMLASRRPGMRPLVGKGLALLQGLLRCADCNRRVQPKYWGRDGKARTATYVCRQSDGWATIKHYAFPARFLDQGVAHQVLEVLTAIDSETANAVVDRERAEHAADERTRRRLLHDAEEDVERARAALLRLAPEFQHARIDVGANLEEALKRRDEVKAKLSAGAARSGSLSHDDVHELVELTRDVRQLWTAPTTTNEDRKRLLRALISEIVVHAVTKEAVDLEIIWSGGLRQPLHVLLPLGVRNIVAARASRKESVPEIAARLKDAGVVTATGRPISENVVRLKLREAGIQSASVRARNRARQIILKGLENKTQRSETLRQLNEETAEQLGPWTPRRLADQINYLRHSSRTGAALPNTLPAEREQQRVLEIIDQRHNAVESYGAIAAHLNAQGLKPSRGAMFNRNIVYQLHRRARAQHVPPSDQELATTTRATDDPADPGLSSAD